MSVPAKFVVAALVTSTVAGVPVRNTPGDIRTLRNSVVRASVVSVDPAHRSAVMRVLCGWHVDPKRRVHLGLWRVDLRGVGLSSFATPLSNAEPESLAQWFRHAERRGWSGWLALNYNGGSLASNGPSTDICHGVLP